MLYWDFLVSRKKQHLESFGIYVRQDCDSSSDYESPECSDEVHIDMDDVKKVVKAAVVMEMRMKWI